MAAFTDRRLYLDTADLLRIGDRRFPEPLVTALRAALAKSQTKLVISPFHVQDAVSRVDTATTERFVRTVETFQPLLAVVDGPDVVEPLNDQRRDIVAEVCANFRELVLSEPAARWLANANEVQDQLHSGDQGAPAVLLESGATAPPRTRAANNLLLQCTISLLRGWLGEDPETILAYWENHGLKAGAPERETVLIRLRGIREMKRALEPLAADDLTEQLRRIGAVGADPSSNPGRMLKARAIAHNQGNPHRHRQRSDWLDVEHVMHFPYVDVATCDGNTLSGIRPAIASEAWPRNPAIFPTGKLELVIEALGGFPGE
jgi:hypothetical protein